MSSVPVLLDLPGLLALMTHPNVADVADPACLVVDIRGAAPVAESVRAALAQWIARQSLPVVCWSQPGDTESFSGLFDVRVEDANALDEITAAIQRRPRAASILVQVLRAGERLDIPAALAVESLGYATLLGGSEFADWLAARDARYARSKAPATPPVRLRRDGELLEVVLDHPQNRNALSVAMRDALADAFRLVMLDPDIRSVRVQGEGPAFCAGGDLSEFGSQRDLAEGHHIRSVRMPAQYLAACRERVHVHVHGACIGAGIELSAFAAHLTAAPDTFFRLPEIAMGLIPGAGGCVSIPRRIGRQRAAFMALSGQDIDAPTALRWGLIDAIR